MEILNSGCGWQTGMSMCITILYGYILHSTVNYTSDTAFWAILLFMNSRLLL